MSLFTQEIAVSLADDTFIFHTQSRPSPLVVPAYVAMEAKTKQVLAVGEEALEMRDHTPDNISVVRILHEGGIADPTLAVELFKYSLRQICGR